VIVRFVDLGKIVDHHFSYIVAVSFISEGNGRTGENH
jgi:hypothetical protein